MFKFVRWRKLWAETSGAAIGAQQSVAAAIPANICERNVSVMMCPFWTFTVEIDKKNPPLRSAMIAVAAHNGRVRDMLICSLQQ